jgi:dihydroxy-acid dehydratase
MGGCDKTAPALMMGATSMNLPAIFFPAGPMLRGDFRGQTLGSGSDAWKYWAELRAGNITENDWIEIENGIARSPGTCMTMGTASTMAALVEVLGFSLPGASSTPAVDSRAARMATIAGRRIVEMVWEDIKPSDIFSPAAVDNAITTVLALGGSTNAIIHLVAMARRGGVALGLDRFDELSKRVPVLANVRPAGKYLMEDFFYAGGLPGLLNVLGRMLHLDCPTVTGKTLRENIAGRMVFNPEVIRMLDNPVASTGGLVVLRGNLAPDGAIMKPVAAEARLLKHSGPAVVFDSYDEMAKRIDDPALTVTADSVLVLRNSGPKGGPGMPEWGHLPIPQKLLRTGVTDMVRISDARMSGTSYGACIVHVAPESFVGGPLGLLKEGDIVEIDVDGRTLNMRVSEQELSLRRASWRAPPSIYPRGYGYMFSSHIRQANEGCDFDFLEGTAPIPEPEIH